MAQFISVCLDSWVGRVGQDIRLARLALWLLLAVAAPGCNPIQGTAAPLPGEVVRVNAGGGAYTDTNSRPWRGDADFTGGNTYQTASPIANTNDDTLYQSERYGAFSYNLAVVPGTYQVTLKFAEIWFNQPGQRVFKVAIEGQSILDNFDILTHVAPNTALDKSFTVAVNDGVMNIVFSSVVNNAKVSAIEVAPAHTLRMNAGGGAYTDTSGSLWSSDSGYSGGNVYRVSAAIANTNDDTLYQSERWGNISYTLPVPNGKYRVTLKFAEIYLFTELRQRVFNVAIEGQTVLSNFDILAEVAPNTALDKSFSVAVNDGALNIVFTSIVNNAKVSAIEVIPDEAGAAPPIIAAAGDIACDPYDGGYNGGNGTASTCRMKATSDLLLSIRPQAVLTLGDNQYEDATLTKFQQSYEPTWGRVKGITYPSLGNHEYRTPGAAGHFDYFGAAAGPRGKGYYSFDLGGWHLIALNSNCAEVGGCGPGSPQEQWLRADLAAHPATCTLAFWHHPRFSSSPYGNDATSQAFWQALYEAGADLVLNGHAHLYERLAPVAPSGAADNARGIRQFIVGTGGRSLYTFGTILSTSEARNADTFGVLRLTLRPTGYDWQFVPEAGRTFTDSGSAECHS